MIQITNEKQTDGFVVNVNSSSSVIEDEKNYVFISSNDYLVDDFEYDEITEEDEKKFYKKAFETKIY